MKLFREAFIRKLGVAAEIVAYFLRNFSEKVELEFHRRIFRVTANQQDAGNMYYIREVVTFLCSGYTTDVSRCKFSRSVFYLCNANSVD